MRICGLLIAGFAAALPAWPSCVSAEDYPTRTVRIIVPQSAGGATDTFARAIGQKLSERWKQPVVIENRVGAGGVIGTEAVAKAPADGYTLLVTYEGSQAINPSLYENLPFNSVRDFEPIATIAVTPFLLIVGPQTKATTFQEFLSLARANPDKLNYGSAGNGSVNHLLGEMLKVEADIRITHVPYKGAPQAISDVIGGHLDLAFASAPSVIAAVQQGLVRALAVSSGQRVAISPETPTIKESGVKDFDVNPWWGIFGPAGLSPSIVIKINTDIAEILKTPDFQEVLAKQGGNVADQLARRVRKIAQEGYREVGKDREGGRGQDELARGLKIEIGRSDYSALSSLGQDWPLFSEGSDAINLCPSTRPNFGQPSSPHRRCPGSEPTSTESRSCTRTTNGVCPGCIRSGGYGLLMPSYELARS